MDGVGVSGSRPHDEQQRADDNNGDGGHPERRAFSAPRHVVQYRRCQRLMSTVSTLSLHQSDTDQNRGSRRPNTTLYTVPEPPVGNVPDRGSARAIAGSRTRLPADRSRRARNGLRNIAARSLESVQIGPSMQPSLVHRASQLAAEDVVQPKAHLADTAVVGR